MSVLKRPGFFQFVDEAEKLWGPRRYYKPRYLRKGQKPITNDSKEDARNKALKDAKDMYRKKFGKGVKIVIQGEDPGKKKAEKHVKVGRHPLPIEEIEPEIDFDEFMGE
jgi:hypothetical protein